MVYLARRRPEKPNTTTLFPPPHPPKKKKEKCPAGIYKSIEALNQIVYRKRSNSLAHILTCVLVSAAKCVLARLDRTILALGLQGFLEVNKVSGNFHFAPGKSFQQQNVHIHDLQGFGRRVFNMTHTIKALSFGHEYPGMENPLDEHVEIALDEGSAMYQYFTKIVPTTYRKISGQEIKTNQYSVTTHKRVMDPARGEVRSNSMHHSDSTRHSALSLSLDRALLFNFMLIPVRCIYV